MIEILDLVLYCAQQLGVMLSVGAETVVLISYVLSMRDGRVDESEARFIKAMRRILGIGLLCIILSGAAIAALHMSLGQSDIVFSPVFLFKWLLVALSGALYLAGWGKQFSHYAIEGFIGATWYALFFVHIVAPAIGWAPLLGFYAAFAAVFISIWVGAVHSLKPEPAIGAQEKPALAARAIPAARPLAAAPGPAAPIPMIPVLPKPAVPPPAPVAPIVPKPAPISAQILPKSPVQPAVPVAAASVARKPAPAPAPAISEPAAPLPAHTPTPAAVAKQDDAHHSPWLPAIHVMPRTPQELSDKSHITPLARLAKTA